MEKPRYSRTRLGTFRHLPFALFPKAQLAARRSGMSRRNTSVCRRGSTSGNGTLDYHAFWESTCVAQPSIYATMRFVVRQIKCRGHRGRGGVLSVIEI